MPQPSSPAIDAANDNVGPQFATDQLNGGRRDGDGDGIVESDLGAVEAPPAKPVPPSLPPVKLRGVSGLVLVDANANVDLGPLVNGSTITLLQRQQLSIRAGGVFFTVRSVRFVYDGAVARTEDVAPYALAGDVNGDYIPFKFTPGTHTLSAEPFDGPGATGNQLFGVTITFTVV